MKIGKIFNQLLKEEYNGHKLLGYHVTSEANIESIRRNGFFVGNRAMQGRGFYSFYEYERATGYGCKSGNSTAIVKFLVTRPKSLIYLNMDIAKQVLGDKYHLIDQVENYYKYYGGVEYFLENCLSSSYVNEYGRGIENLTNYLNNIENTYPKHFRITLISSREDDKLNVLYDGEYGIEMRFNNVNLLKPIGFNIISCLNGNNLKNVEFSILDDIPNTDEFKPLRDFIINLNLQDATFDIVKNKLDKLLETIRSSREFNELNKIWDLIYKIKKS